MIKIDSANKKDGTIVVEMMNRLKQIKEANAICFSLFFCWMSTDFVMIFLFGSIFKNSHPSYAICVSLLFVRAEF